MKKLFLLLFILSCMVAACKKSNDDPKPSNADRKTLLAGTWKLTAQTYSPPFDYDGDGTPEADAYSVLEPCQKDNLVTFLSGGIWKEDFGSLICDWEDTPEGKWALSEDGNIITIDGENYTILQLDQHILKIQLKFNNPEDGVTYTVTLTMARQ